MQIEEVVIPAEFEAAVHHEPQGEPCEETPAEVAEEVEAEAEMLYEGGPPEPPVRAEAEPEPEAEELP